MGKGSFSGTSKNKKLAHSNQKACGAERGMLSSEAMDMRGGEGHKKQGRGIVSGDTGMMAGGRPQRGRCWGRRGPSSKTANAADSADTNLVLSVSGLRRPLTIWGLTVLGRVLQSRFQIRPIARPCCPEQTVIVFVGAPPEADPEIRPRSAFGG